MSFIEIVLAVLFADLLEGFISSLFQSSVKEN